VTSEIGRIGVVRNNGGGGRGPPEVKNEDAEGGELIVRFRAGGLLEMAWHLLQWGNHVEVLAPTELKELMPEVRLSWPALP
jgi:predicted DNA-binding transcriptional regulator YafY